MNEVGTGYLNSVRGIATRKSTKDRRKQPGRQFGLFARWIPLFLIGFLTSFQAPAQEFTDEDCLSCHGDSEISSFDFEELADMVVPAEPGKGRDPALVRRWRERNLYVDPASFEDTPHDGFSCAECHPDIEEIPHAARLEPAACLECHEGIMEKYSKSIHRIRILEGDMEAPRCGDCHGVHRILPPSSPDSLIAPKNEPALCASCHSNPDMDIQAKAMVITPAEGYFHGVHGRMLLENGHTDAASCSDCHTAHSIRRLGDPESSVFFKNIPETCGKCHPDVVSVFNESVHGVGLQMGNRDVPTCVDCHGEHDILPADDPDSRVFAGSVSSLSCSSCHESLRLIQRYDMRGGRVESFQGSYHGLASRLGSTTVANCASCHGIHNILPSIDPKSTVHPDNLQVTCGKCHLDAGPTFATVQIHQLLEKPDHPVVALVRKFYLLLIVVVIGGMAGHNLLIWVRAVIEKQRRLRVRRARKRFMPIEMFQHVVLAISFILLAMTGFALKYPDSKLVVLFHHLGLDEGLRSTVHRICGVTLVVFAFLHILYLALTNRGRAHVIGLLPRLTDVREFRARMAYYLGFRKSLPHRGEFDYTEKSEYWALVWGTAIMAVTGFFLWFPEKVTAVLPNWFIELSEVIHFYEAVLATLAIIVWHLFFVIFHPESYPLNLSMFTGLENLEEEHEEEEEV